MTNQGGNTPPISSIALAEEVGQTLAESMKASIMHSIANSHTYNHNAALGTTNTVYSGTHDTKIEVLEEKIVKLEKLVNVLMAEFMPEYEV